MPIKSIDAHAPPFIAFINGAIVNIIWIFEIKITKIKLFPVKVKTDYYKIMTIQNI